MWSVCWLTCCTCVYVCVFISGSSQSVGGWREKKPTEWCVLCEGTLGGTLQVCDAHNTKTTANTMWYIQIYIRTQQPWSTHVMHIQVHTTKHTWCNKHTQQNTCVYTYVSTYMCIHVIVPIRLWHPPPPPLGCSSVAQKWLVLPRLNRAREPWLYILTISPTAERLSSFWPTSALQRPMSL